MGLWLLRGVDLGPRRIQPWDTAPQPRSHGGSLSSMIMPQPCPSVPLALFDALQISQGQPGLL